MQPNETTSRAEVTVRRSPRYGMFIVVTIVVFVIASFIATYSLPVSGEYSQAQVFGYMILVSIVLGAAIGGLVAMLADKITAHTTRTVVAERVDARGADDAADSGAELEAAADGVPAAIESGDAARESSASES